MTIYSETWQVLNRIGERGYVFVAADFDQGFISFRMWEMPASFG